MWTRGVPPRSLAVATSSLLVSLQSHTNLLCESEKPLIKRDKDGNVQLTATISQFTDREFWDSVASRAGEEAQKAIETGIPTQLSYGFISGYCSGLALKKVGRAAATVFGLGFVCLQTLSYQGYIQVDHLKLKKEIESYLDLNNDGKVDSQDTQIATTKILQALQYNMPAGSGFAAGFIGGLRSG